MLPAETRRAVIKAVAMLHTGQNIVNGVHVEVVRKGIRRINIRVMPDGCVIVSVPCRWATLHEAEAFLREKWGWVVKTRTETMSRPSSTPMPPSANELGQLQTTLGELNAQWTARLGENDVKWRLRQMKTLWGSCHWRRRVVTYNSDLAKVPRELVEYVVVHELTHLRVHDHGPKFQKLMTERLPNWRALRRRLNKRDYCDPLLPVPPVASPAEPVVPPVYYQAELPLHYFVALLLMPQALALLCRFCA